MSWIVLNRTLRILHLFFILIWTDSLNGQPLSSVQEKNRNMTKCEFAFEINVQHCLHRPHYYKWQIGMLSFLGNNNIFREILKRYFCRQYTNSLQCVHETLAACRSDQTTNTVRTYLSQPWACQYNAFCDINQQNNSTASKNNLTVSQNNSTAAGSHSVEQSSGIESKVNNTGMQTTINKITGNSISKIYRPILFKQEMEVLSAADNKSNTRQLPSASQQDQTTNTRNNISNKVLFYEKSIKTVKSEKNTLEYSLLFQKLTSSNSRFSIKSAVSENPLFNKPTENTVEIQIG